MTNFHVLLNTGDDLLLNDGTSFVLLNLQEAVISEGGGSYQRKQDFVGKRKIKVTNISESRFIHYLRNRNKSKLVWSLPNLAKVKMFYEDRNVIESLIQRDFRSKVESSTVFGKIINKSEAKPYGTCTDCHERFTVIPRKMKEERLLEALTILESM